ncbi:MAG: hypothetical protein LBP67_04795 [Bacteroidales bacterium]|jgi:RHS repeat-associated protein|nr:hypothetical protein [Bacteroidales bacterium]
MLLSETSTTAKKEYSYDEYLRLNEVTETILTDGKSFIFGYQYDSYGKLTKEIYPHSAGDVANSTLNYEYDTYGYTVKKFLGTTLIWEAKQYAEQGQLSKYILGNNITVTKEFDNQGRLTNITGLKGSNIYQNMSYGYRGDGNMHYRTDAANGVNKKEWFKYDTQNRLIGWETTNLNSTEPEYQTRISYSGNKISQKENIGNYGYSGFPHHGVKSSGVTTATNNPLDISYDHNMIDGRARVSSIISGNNSVTYTHGTSDELIKKTETKNGNTYTTYYAGGGKYELRIDNNNAETKLSYLGSGVVKYDAPGTTDDKMLYLLKDHLGSVVKVLSINNNSIRVEESFSYDVWGNRRNPITWANTNITTPIYIYKGFTGHEHIEGFGLIHMKGRVYDPALGLFLSPDPYVQSATAMGFNRYSYCMGNPLMYTDPDGETLGMAAYVFFYTCFFFSNLDNQPFQTAFNETNEVMTGLSEATQWTIYESDGHKVSVGFDMLGLGVYAGYSYTWGSGSAYLSVGYSLMGEFNAGVGVSQNIKDFNVSLGAGYGNNHWGWNSSLTYKGYGLGYGQTYYGNAVGQDGNPNNQMVGQASVFFPGGSLRIENDFFGDGLDRWRSSAIEISIGDFVFGKTVYTNSPYRSESDMIYDEDYESRIFGKNKKGTYNDSKVFSSPFYVGYKSGNRIERIGINHPMVQDITQNGWHKLTNVPYFYTPYGEYCSPYFYTGYNNPFSLYGR